MAPIGCGKQSARTEDHDRMNQQGDHRQLHLARPDLLAEVFG